MFPASKTRFFVLYNQCLFMPIIILLSISKNPSNSSPSYRLNLNPSLPPIKMNNYHQWSIRPEGTNPTFQALYGSNFNTTYTTIRFHHSGKFTPTPGRDYVREKTTIVDYVRVKKLSFNLLSEIIMGIDWRGQPTFYGFERNFGLDLGLFRLQSEYDFEKYFNKIFPDNCNQIHDIYVEVNGKTHIASFPNSLKKADPRVIEKMCVDFVEDNPGASLKQGVHFGGVWGVDNWNQDDRGFQSCEEGRGYQDVWCSLKLKTKSLLRLICLY